MPLPRSIILDTAKLAYDDIRETYPELNMPPSIPIEIAGANMTTTKGYCRFVGNKRVGYKFSLIRLSQYFADRIDVDETMRHEVAHMVAGHDAEHGPEWVAVAKKFGLANPGPCSSADMDLPQKPGYTVYCQVCKKEWIHQRKTKFLKAVHARTADYYECPKCKNTGSFGYY